MTIYTMSVIWFWHLISYQFLTLRFQINRIHLSLRDFNSNTTPKESQYSDTVSSSSLIFSRKRTTIKLPRVCLSCLKDTYFRRFLWKLSISPIYKVSHKKVTCRKWTAFGDGSTKHCHSFRYSLFILLVIVYKFQLRILNTT